MKNANTALKIDPQVGDALMEDADLMPIAEILTGDDPKQEAARMNIYRALESLGINDAETLRAKKHELMKALREKVAGLFVNETAPAAKKAPARVPGPNEFTAENVAEKLKAYAKDPMIQMVLALTPKQQVRALNRAGVRFFGQLDVTNERQMNRLGDAVATVRTRISPEKGRSGVEILTPTGAGRDR